MTIPEINIEEAKRRLDNDSATFVDIRDPESHSAGRIQGASRLDNDSIQTFLAETKKSRAVIVYCYHGNSSRMATSYLIEQGFEEVYSMSGGFEAWRLSEDVASD